MPCVRQSHDVVHVVYRAVDLHPGRGGKRLGERAGDVLKAHGRRRVVGQLDKDVKALPAGKVNRHVAFRLRVALVDRLHKPAGVGQGVHEVRPVDVQHEPAAPARPRESGHAVPVRPVVRGHLRAEDEMRQVRFAFVLNRAVGVGGQQVGVSTRGRGGGRCADDVRADVVTRGCHFGPPSPCSGSMNAAAGESTTRSSVNPLYVVPVDAVVAALQRDHEPHEVFPPGFGERRQQLRAVVSPKGARSRFVYGSAFAPNVQVRMTVFPTCVPSVTSKRIR